MKTTIKKLPKSEIQIEVVIDAKEFESYHDRGFKKVQELTNIDGFRKGHASEDVIVKAYGDMIILEEMANIALRDAYVQALTEHKLIPVADPKVTITKLAKGNPLELNLIVTVMPEITLPDYKKLAQEKVKEQTVETVTNEEIETVVEELRKGRATHNHHEHDHKEGEECKHEPVLPELNDEFAQSFGDSFKNLDDLKSKVGENLKLEKEQKHKEKVRSGIMETLITESKSDLPEVMIEQELDRMFAQMKHDVTRYGGTFEDYLKHSGKTEADLRNDWRNDAIKRTMSQLILAEISLIEKIKPTDEEIETELVRILATIQGADEERARAYLFQAITNDKVLKFLEGDKK